MAGRTMIGTRITPRPLPHHPTCEFASGDSSMQNEVAKINPPPTPVAKSQHQPHSPSEHSPRRNADPQMRDAVRMTVK